MIHVKISALLLFALWVQPLSGQHLPAVPNFCAGNFCISSGPVVSGDKLNYPSFHFVKGGRLDGSTYLVEYSDFGQIKLTARVADLASCDNVDKPTNGLMGIDGLTWHKTVCKAMPDGRFYILDISLHGFNFEKIQDICNQAFDGLWIRGSFHGTSVKYEPVYTKVDLDLKQVKQGACARAGIRNQRN
jgi:hypothetical protein